jgi:hypothetical protein
MQFGRRDDERDREEFGELFGSAEQRRHALGVLCEVGGVLIRGRLVVGPPGGALQAHDVAADVGDVEREAYFRVGRDVAQLLFLRPAVEQDRLVVAQQEPDGDGDWLPVRAHGGQPSDEIAVQPLLDSLAVGRRQMRREFHRCLPTVAARMLLARAR